MIKINEELLNMSTRKLLKNVGVNSQRIIETSIRDAVKSGKITSDKKINVSFNLNIVYQKKLRVKLKLQAKIFFAFLFFTKDVFANLEICKNPETQKENAFICNQDKVYDSLLSNPLAFVFFYVFSIVFIALLFQLSQRKKNKKK